MSKIEYSDLLFEISKKLGENELRRLIFMCREEIAKGSEENIRDVLTLFEELEKQDRLGIDRLDTLKEILKQMKKRSLLKKVEEFEIRRKAQSVGIVSSLKRMATSITGAVKLVCKYRTIAGGLLVVTSGVALCSCSSLDEFVEVFNKVVLPSFSKLVEISEGSLCFTVQADTSSALKELWDMYKTGTLQNRLQEFLATDEIKQLASGEDFEVTVYIDEQEYKAAYLDLMLIQKEGSDETEEERLGGRRRRNSDSFLCFKPNEDDLTLIKLKLLENKWNLEKQRRQLLEEENKKLRAEIAVAEHVQKRLVCQEEESVPAEIVVRGRRALEAYNKALAEGKTFDKRVPVMLIGQDRSGKTSLKKSLRGELFNPDEESTVGIDVDPSHFQVSNDIWKAGKKDQETSSKMSISFEYLAARVTVENLKQEKSVVEEKVLTGTTDLADNDFIPLSPVSHSCLSGVSSTSTQALQSPMGTTVSPASYSSVSDVSMDSELGSNISHIPKDIEIEMLERMQNKREMEDEEGIYSVLWDFAGHLVYYTTHPLFLTSGGMYLLVYDLSQNPSETAKPVVKQGVYRTFEHSFGMKTNMDYLDFWLFSIASLACQSERGPIGSNSEVLPEKLPPVFLVCTHADRPYDGGDPSTLARGLFGSLQTKPYNKHLHDVFVVDNTKSGLESECPEIVRLRNEVLAIAKELPQMKEAIPIKWLKFEKELQAMSKEGHKWISLETATSIASERCNVVDTEEFKTLLNFLHDKRILIHFDDTPELNELVVLDPQWLVDVFKKVITVKPYNRQSKKFTELWRKLENKGILDEKLLEQVWGPLFDDRATCDSLLQIMGKFNLLCPWPSSDSPCGKQYLVPSMLRTHPPEDIMNLVEVASRRIPPLFLKFESGQVPPGLFPRLVLLFLQWGKQICLRPERTELFNNFARFFTSEEENWSVILLCLSSSIKVVVHGENPIHDSGIEILPSLDASYGTSDVTFPCKVRRQLGMILESMRNEFCWLKYMRYETSFICPVCCIGGAVRYCDTHHVARCTQEGCLHFWSHSQLLNAKSIIYCTKSVAAVKSRVQTVQFTPWFTTQGNQLTTDQHDGDNLASVEESEAKALVRSSGVLKSLQTTCDVENVAALLAESLKLDEATLADPGPEKTRLIRCLSMEAKNMNRLDVVKHLRQITPAGTTGPLLPERLDVTHVSQSKLRELTIHLCGAQEWKLLAEKLGLSPAKIRFLDSRTLNPCMEVLFHIRKQRFLDVGTLYDALVECGFPMLADML